MSEKSPFIEEYRRFAQTKSLGQHFLTNPLVVERMVQAAQITREDTILEIGPGLGILSEKLIASSAKEIILCEKDERLVMELKKKITNKRAKIISQDALILIPQLQVSPPFKVVANLPYNISSPVITSLLTFSPTLPDLMILMLQKEVAQRLSSSPGDTNRGILSVLVELYGEPKIIDHVSKNHFYPSPKVDSSVLRIANIKDPKIDTKTFMKMLKFSFAGKRKKIKNSLFSSLNIPKNEMIEIASSSGVSLDDRPEDLDLKNWLALHQKLEKYL
jgi:16S rRNA (adenine1518-N6/adenine1519-N6)-dimethyltransferase